MGTRNSIAILLLFCSIAGAQFVWGPRKILPIPPPVTVYRFEVTNGGTTIPVGGTIRQSDCMHPWDTNKDCWISSGVSLWTNMQGLIGRSWSNRQSAGLSGWVSTNQVCWFSNEIHTVTIWFKPNAGGKAYEVIREGNYPWTYGNDWAIDHDGLRLRYIYVTNKSPTYKYFQLHVTGQPATNEWNFVVAYYQPIQLGIAVLNSMNPTASFQVSNCSLMIWTNRGLMDIGNANNVNVTNIIDEVCIFDRILTDNEIKWMYNQGRGSLGYHVMGYGKPGISITR